YGDWCTAALAESNTAPVHAPPRFIQEKYVPRALIEDLRREQQQRQHKQADDHPSLFDANFGDFDGLEELDLVDFYTHSANWSNRLILGDSLQVMGSLVDRENLRG